MSISEWPRCAQLSDQTTLNLTIYKSTGHFSLHNDYYSVSMILFNFVQHHCDIYIIVSVIRV